ncbi:serine/threonine protein kinase [Streptomyces sp. NBC_01275]|uniref:serine/threonine-protein kinase n=1 Tax=Streptomyces sp. NBC_01275 TaxID=2903807 RepID=UPI00224FF1A5|nr:serine/threonine-protein kinase [Streptomyces sp. NBC_01275]MCX4761945.1 serine/threonine protein kinase [Streptomyces sp. NBC_01275]
MDETIGQGGMGRVWRSHDETLNRNVAVKEVLLPEGLLAAEREVLLQRTLREAQVAAQLNHPGIITVHDVVRDGEEPWIVMELVAGESLAGLIARSGRLPWPQVAALATTMADALAHAHTSGVVHRDLKPDNVLIVGSRTVITDFGIARVLDGSAGTRLTATGAIIGTPQYMPPEQLEGADAAPSGDLWSLGATLYTAVEGHAPFDGSSLMALCHAILNKPLEPPSHAGKLAPLLHELMSKSPTERPTAAALVGRLDGIQRPAEPPHGRPADPRQIQGLRVQRPPENPPPHPMQAVPVQPPNAGWQSTRSMPERQEKLVAAQNVQHPVPRASITTPLFKKRFTVGSAGVLFVIKTCILMITVTSVRAAYASDATLWKAIPFSVIITLFGLALWGLAVTALVFLMEIVEPDSDFEFKSCATFAALEVALVLGSFWFPDSLPGPLGGWGKGLASAVGVG